MYSLVLKYYGTEELKVETSGKRTQENTILLRVLLSTRVSIEYLLEYSGVSTILEYEV